MEKEINELSMANQLEKELFTPAGDINEDSIHMGHAGTGAYQRVFFQTEHEQISRPTEAFFSGKSPLQKGAIAQSMQSALKRATHK